MLLKHEKIISFSIRWISGRESAYNAGDTGDTGLISESGGSSAGENGSPLQYSCLENSMGRGARQATVHGAIKSCTQLKRVACMQVSN